MTKKEKIFLSILFCLPYILGYFFLFKELQKINYDITAIFLGSFFTLFGLLGHSAILFEEKWSKFERNKKYMNITKYFFKSLGTVLTVPFGVFCFYYGILAEYDNYTLEDIKLFKATLREKPKFKKGAKSSTYLKIYLNEFPEYTFEPIFEKYIHTNTNFEDDANIGDTIILGIMNEDFEKSIIKTKKKTYMDNHSNAHQIAVYYVQKGKTNYYNIELHNQLSKDDSKYSPFIGIIFGSIFLIGAISIWLTELLILLRRKGQYSLADKLEGYRNRKII